MPAAAVSVREEVRPLRGRIRRWPGRLAVVTRRSWGIKPGPSRRSVVRCLCLTALQFIEAMCFAMCILFCEIKENGLSSYES